MRRVLLEPVGKMHTYLRTLVDYPPEGYEVVVSDAARDKVVRRSITERLCRTLGRFVSPFVIKPYLDKFLKRLPKDMDLIYASGRVVVRNQQPWVVEGETLQQLAGYYTARLPRCRPFIQRTLSSRYGKRIIRWTYSAANR